MSLPLLSEPQRPATRAVLLALISLAQITLAQISPAAAASLENIAPQGSYALNKADCPVEKFVTFSKDRIDFTTYSCSKVDYDQQSNGGGKIVYQVKAKACQGEEDAKPHPDTFTLILEGETLQVVWSDKSRSAKAQRCPH